MKGVLFGLALGLALSPIAYHIGSKMAHKRVSGVFAEVTMDKQAYLLNVNGLTMVRVVASPSTYWRQTLLVLTNQ